MEFIHPDIQRYAELHTDPESELLARINRETHLHVLKPRMLSGHFQGRFLSMISRLIRPKRVLEIGTYTGYSALCLAEGLPSDGKIITIDKNPEQKIRIEGYLKESNFSEQITMLVGDAMEIIPTLSDKWDLVFIDADKENYLNYYKLVIDHMNVGGYILADNVLWSGKVVDQRATDKDTEALRNFNSYVHNDQRVSNVLVPIRDGLMMLCKN